MPDRLDSVRQDVNGPEKLDEQFMQKYVYGDYSDGPPGKPAPGHSLKEDA